MRVALFSDAVPPRLDGVAVTVERLTQELAARGHEVALVGPGPFDDVPGASVHVRLPGIPLPTLPGLHGSLPRLGRFERALDHFAPQLVHALTEMPVGLAGRRYALGHGVPFVTSAHTDYPAYVRHWGFAAAESSVVAWMRWFHAPARVTMCPSRSYLDVMCARGVTGELRVWGRGVDAERFSPAHRSAAFRARFAVGDAKLVLAVGRIVPEKRLDRVLDAHTSATGGDPARSVLLLAGEGAARASIARRAPPNVVFLGPLRGHALAEAYASSDLFVTASEEETFGNTVLEAMASGLPVVVPRAGALHELVTWGSGAVVDTRRPAALAAAIASLLREDARCARGRAARKVALERTWQRATDEVLGAYTMALGDRRPT